MLPPYKYNGFVENIFDPLVKTTSNSFLDRFQTIGSIFLLRLLLIKKEQSTSISVYNNNRRRYTNGSLDGFVKSVQNEAIKAKYYYIFVNNNL